MSMTVTVQGTPYEQGVQSGKGL
ncbi:MAG: hypothetical protein K0Q90_2488, partial [Paenibacillaceae bacterium]|nr:hypothetical protein [Paenibacillaceae bacterium]